MNRPSNICMYVIAIMSLSSATGCWTKENLRTAKTATDAALTVAQIACVFAATFTDSREVAQACGVVNELDRYLPLIDKLIGQREAAKKSGVKWENDFPDAGSAPRDAGKP